ncbi:ABC transporter ATP-binding protein [Streptococcus sp. DD13]|uniref:ABC transporter ATP-binding protein n=1 Tax=Streptococcus sp. DD13 TaxID=1777881 RepID=UPI0007953C4B|nr:ABC transporter ATP-binding protein [Streptococcus sp. DD13]KXT78767.1 ABC transporter, ATP-binding/permease protein [Streptococcus sp. DD13]
MKFFLQYFKQYKKETILGPLFKLLEACFELVVPLVIAAIVDNIIPHSNRPSLVAMILLLVLFASIGITVSLIAQYFSAKAAVGVTKELTHDLYQKVLSLPKSSRDEISADSLLNRLTSDALQIQTGINTFLRLFLRAPIVVFGAFLMAFFISPSLSLLFLVMILTLTGIIAFISWISNRYYARLRKQLDRLVGLVRENVLGIRVIRAFGQEEREIQTYTTENQAYLQIQTKANYWSSILSPATFIVVNGTLLLLIYQGNVAIGSGLLEQGSLVALTNYLSQILVELVKMVTTVSTMNQTYISLKRVKEVFQLESENLDQDLPVSKAPQSSDQIEIKGLSFAYPHAAEEALKNVSFKLSNHQFMGVIGSTGSGKSTLVQLLLHLYPASKGEVLVYKDGRSPRSLREWRQLFAIVPQQAQLFSGTVRSNLTLGLDREKISDEQIWNALRIAQAADFIAQKDGLDTVVEAFGRNFSGGQRQRLTIARALLHPAPILLLDDSTSALDYLTESKLLSAIRKELPEKSLIMISQRTNSLKQADQILVLDKGQQVGLGRHEELLKESSVYKEIDASQHSRKEEA